MLVPRNKPPAAPAEVPWGAPPAPISVVTCDLSGRQVSADALAAEVRALAKVGAAGGDYPDLLILAHIGADEAMALARLMGMEASYRPQHHQRARGAAGFIGVCVLSRHPLYEGGPVRLDRKQSAGLSAVAVAGERKFRVACLVTGAPDGGGIGPLIERRNQGDAPMLLALVGEAGAVERQRKMLAESFGELAPQNQGPGIALLGTRSWRVVTAATAGGGMAWHVLDGGESSGTSATRPGN
jgi:hypothetical protein